MLVSALASHGQMSDALDIYEEIKEAGFNLEPKAAISLIVSFCMEMFYTLYVVNKMTFFLILFRNTINLKES